MLGTSFFPKNDPGLIGGNVFLELLLKIMNRKPILIFPASIS